MKDRIRRCRAVKSCSAVVAIVPAPRLGGPSGPDAATVASPVG